MLLVGDRGFAQSYPNSATPIKDSEAFVDALFNPPKPNDALKAAAVRYKQIMSA